MEASFVDLGLDRGLVAAITDLGYEVPTPIQAGAIPILLDGRDVLGQAQTGTGKTAAFALPMLQGLAPERGKVQGLVVTPTRELAIQVAKAIYSYSQHDDVRVIPVYGGQSYSRQIGRLERGVDIVVGTPGRMLDLIRRGVLDLSGVHYLVLDEADEMLSMGFIEDIEAILTETPASRQTALFSATLPDAVRALADRYMRSPEAIIVNPTQLTVENIEQRCYLVHESDKLAALALLLETEDVTSTLIFVRTKVGAADLVDALVERGFQAEALHGDMNQPARETVMARFRREHVAILVATDVAARGLDIDGISHVINYDLPYEAEYYVHRIGRTGRAGRTGTALSLVTPQERWRISKIQRYTRSTIAYAKLPTVAQVTCRRDAQFLDKLADQMALDAFERERDLVLKLIKAGCDPVDIAAATMQLARAGEQQRPVVEVAEVQLPSRHRGAQHGRRERTPRRPQSHGQRRGQEAGMVRLSLNVGAAQGVRPSEIVGGIAGMSRIPGKAIGAIDIQHHYALVDVAEQHADHVLRKMKGWKLRGRVVELQRAE
ncbi:MAG: DEAD/DEAH box helicase [Anaerolineae bacterium]|nr:DEAD/DEAH box helicase [Anaerolineae bacterium]